MSSQKCYTVSFLICSVLLQLWKFRVPVPDCPPLTTGIKWQNWLFNNFWEIDQKLCTDSIDLYIPVKFEGGNFMVLLCLRHCFYIYQLDIFTFRLFSGDNSISPKISLDFFCHGGQCRARWYTQGVHPQYPWCVLYCSKIKTIIFMVYIMVYLLCILDVSHDSLLLLQMSWWRTNWVPVVYTRGGW